MGQAKTPCNYQQNYKNKYKQFSIGLTCTSNFAYYIIEEVLHNIKDAVVYLDAYFF